VSSVLIKLNQARKLFHERGLKKTGRNEFAGYDYFELADFLVPALEIFESLQLSGVVSFGVELATMTITDLEDGSQFVITSPMSTAKLKACHEVQNLGAVQTYLRRYLWVAALEIVEHDALNLTQGKGEKRTPRHNPVPDAEVTAEQQAHVAAIVNDIVACFEEGNEIEGIAIYYRPDTFADNEERIHAWNLLKPHSKIRSVIKNNKPQPQPVAA
jgi:hypothetical protein